jgi:hypothetical protein
MNAAELLFNNLGLLELPIDLDPILQVPLVWPLPLLPGEIEVDIEPYTDKKFMINYINNILAEFGEEIKDIRFSKYKHQWTIEYGTRLIEDTVRTHIEISRIKNGRLCAMEAAHTASEKFGYDEEYAFMTPPAICKRLWSLIKIDIGYCSSINKYRIRVSVETGCRASYCHVLKIFRAKMCEIKNYFWNPRKNYLMLFNGLTLEPTKRDTLLDYLFNEVLTMEISSYLA